MNEIILGKRITGKLSPVGGIRAKGDEWDLRSTNFMWFNFRGGILAANDKTKSNNV